MNQSNISKKGEPLNQLAIISDLIDKMNIDVGTKTIILGLGNEEFHRIFTIVQKKFDQKFNEPNDTFKINIGEVEIIFTLI